MAARALAHFVLIVAALGNQEEARGGGQEAFDASCLLQSALPNNSASVENLMRVRTGNSSNSGGYNLLRVGGPWAGFPKLMSLLMKDLPGDLQLQGGDCNVYYMSGWVFSTWAWRDLKKTQPEATAKNPEAFIIVNQEFPENEYVWNRLPKSYIKRAIILGNWWNSTHADYRDENVTSMWVPYASLSFANRAMMTPMDLVNRGQAAQAALHSKLQACSQSFIFDENGNKNLPKEAVYMQRSCFASRASSGTSWQNFRELFWDELNRRMIEELNTTGTALGVCNGKQNLGTSANTGVKMQGDTYSRLSGPCEGKPSTAYDEAVAAYSHFKVTVALENTISDLGYVTEKPINAFLAGSVPIYAGSHHITQFFNPKSFIQLEPGKNDAEVVTSVLDVLRNETRRTAMLKEKVVHDDAIRRWFSWHPAVWPSHGDRLRRRIVGELLSYCKAHPLGGKLRSGGQK